MRRGWVAGLVIILLLAAVLITALIAGPEGSVLGRLNGGVGVVNIEGTIVSGATGLFSTVAGSRNICEQLGEAREDESIKAVVLRINSPGGSAAASQEIADAVRSLRTAGKPVVACMGDSAASGAYWVCCQADSIVAQPATLTGSIGVIMEVPNAQGLMDKLGIDVEIIKSGPHKDMGSGTRQITSEERQIMQGMVDDIFDQFVETVSQGRHLSRSEVLRFADGSILTGRQALNRHLVDELGGYEKALAKARELAALPEDAPVREMGCAAPLEQWLSGVRGTARPKPSLDAGIWLVAPALISQEAEIND